MTFFYDLNKRMADLARKQTLAEDKGSKPDFLDLDRDGNKKESMKKAADDMDESALQAFIGKKKYGEQGMKALQQAGRDGASKEKMSKIRTQYNKMDEAEMEEGNEFSGELVKARAQGAKEFKVDGKSYPVKEASINIPGASMPTGPFDNRHWLDITGSKDKNFKVAKPDHELDGKTVTVIAWSKNGKSVVVDFEGQRYNVSPRDLEQRNKVREAKAKPDFLDLDQDGNRKESMKKAAADKKKSKSAGTAFDPETAKSMFANKDDHPRYNVKDTGYSKVYTRKSEETTDDDDTDTSSAKDGAPKKRGRPKGKDKGPERVTSKSYKYKSGRPTNTKENLDSDGVMMTRPSNMSSEGIESIALVDKGEYDREGEMAKQQMHTIMRAAKQLHSMLSNDENLPEWVQKKITLAQNYLDGVSDYMTSVAAERQEQPIAEKAVSQKQQKFMGMAHAMQKGAKIKGASPELKKVAKTMNKSDVEDFASTKHKGLPKKAKTEETAEAPKEKKSKGGYDFGGSVYESYNKQFTKLLNEGMDITINMGAGEQGEPRKSITVTADGDDADTLAAMLKMAGIGGQEEACSSCGTAPCGCQELDENSPDWPTNTETSDDAMQYSGGLNGPKSTGQTTVPVVASQLRRQASMEEGVELERSLFKLYNNYKNQ